MRTIADISANYKHNNPVKEILCRNCHRKRKMNTLEKKTVVVNLFAAPGVGKTTTMAAVFAKLKESGVDAELAPEFVKEMIWENREVDELYVLAKQNHRIFRLNGKVDVVVTDRPLILTALYNHENKPLCNMAYDAMRSYRNLNIVLLRNTKHAYNHNGRFQTEEESKAMDAKIPSLLKEYAIDYVSLLSADDESVKKIVEMAKTAVL